MEKREICKKLWNSLDMKYVQSWVFISLIGFSIMSLADLPGVGAIVFLPFMGYAWWRRWKILRKAEAYELHRAKLVQPYARFGMGMYSFAAILEDQSDVLQTDAIFAVRSLDLPQMQDYVNQTVTIAYNPETEMVVVMG